MLVPGERDIRETADQLERVGAGNRGHSVVRAAEFGDQQRRGEAHTRVVVATNIAETSLTITRADPFP